MKHKNRHRILSAVLAVGILVGVLAGCQGKQEPADEPDNQPEVSVKETLVFGLIQEPTTLDSLTATERITFLPVGAIYDTLVDCDEDQNIVPKLAEDWTISEDGLEYVFQIRQGVKFHHGQTLTVEDVAYTIEQLRTINASNFGLINHVEVVDDSHVKITLDYAFSPLLYLFSQPATGIVNREEYEANPEAYGRNPNGTGPFQYENWLSGDNIVLIRFEDYWQGPAALKSITFRILAEESTELIALEAGEIDAYIQVAQSNKDLIESNDSLLWYEAPGSQVFTLAFNNGTYSNGEKSIFADNKALRQAVCYAINKEDLVIGAIEGAAPALYTPYPAFVANYPKDFDGNVYDLEKAKEKLEEAGYPDGLTIKIRTTTQAIYSTPAQLIQGQLAQIGINLELDEMERGTYLQEVYNDLDYDLTVWAVSCDYPDADHGAYKRFYSGMIGGGNNYMQINDPELDEAILTNRTSQDNAERAAAVERIAEIIRDESYCLPLYASPQTLAANAELKGVNIGSDMGIDFYTWEW